MSGHLIHLKDYQFLISKMSSLVPSDVWQCRSTSEDHQKFGELMISVGELSPKTLKDSEELAVDPDHIPDRKKLGKYRKGLLLSKRRTKRTAQVHLRAICRAYLHLVPTDEMFELCVKICDLGGFDFCLGKINFSAEGYSRDHELHPGKTVIRSMYLGQLAIVCGTRSFFTNFATFGIVTPDALSELLKTSYLQSLFSYWNSESGSILFPTTLSLETTETQILVESRKEIDKEKWRKRYGGESIVRKRYFSEIMNCVIHLANSVKHPDFDAKYIGETVDLIRIAVEGGKKIDGAFFELDLFEDVVFDDTQGWQFRL